MTRIRVAFGVLAILACLSVVGCDGAACVGYDDGASETEFRAGFYHSEQIERPDGSSESREIIGPHVEFVTRSEGAHIEAGANSN